LSIGFLNQGTLFPFTGFNRGGSILDSRRAADIRDAEKWSDTMPQTSIEKTLEFRPTAATTDCGFHRSMQHMR